LLLGSACQRQSNICPQDSITYFSDIDSLSQPIVGLDADLASTPTMMEIDGKMVAVDRVIHGLVCNETLNGTVYVACDIQIEKWVDTPTFLEACAFTVEPGSTIYVAAHNNAAYYKGCSCHTGELADY
jgi:hypothetical protein